ncbi:MAG: hypothetical protein AAB513_02985 [Patescibacteria group bacterium]
MLTQTEKAKLMKQIFIVLILLVIAYSVSFFSNEKDLNKKETFSNEEISVKVAGYSITKIDKSKIMAQVNSLDEKTRKEILDSFGIIE